MRIRDAVLIVALSMTGCSAHLDSHLSKNDPNAPVNEINGGVVSYLNQGADSVIASRRTDAYKKMHDECDGPYRIVSESDSDRGGFATSFGDSTVYGNSRYRLIKFECVN